MSFVTRLLGIKKPDPRMRDAELVIRYFAFRNFLQTTGNLKPLPDSTAKHFNVVWQSEQGNNSEAAERFRIFNFDDGQNLW
jgi:hypothetical protein